METLCPHEYDIPLVRGGHLEGPHVFGFLICAFVSELWPQTWGTSIQGEMNNWNPWLMLKCYFTENCVSFKYLSSTSATTSIFHFKRVLPFPIKIHPIKIFTRATPGISLDKTQRRNKLRDLLFTGSCSTICETYSELQSIREDGPLPKSSIGC